MVVVLGYWNMGPVTISADLAAGLGGNLGVVCPTVESYLGDMLEG